MAIYLGSDRVKLTRTEVDTTIENQIITPTLKIRRHQAKKFFEKEINKLYGIQG